MPRAASIRIALMAAALGAAACQTVSYDPVPPDVPVTAAPLSLVSRDTTNMPEPETIPASTLIASLSFVEDESTRWRMDVFGCGSDPETLFAACEPPRFEIDGRPVKAPDQLAERAVRMRAILSEDKVSGGIEILDEPRIVCSISGPRTGLQLDVLYLTDEGYRMKHVYGKSESCHFFVPVGPRSEAARLEGRALIELLSTIVALRSTAGTAG